MVGTTIQSGINGSLTAAFQDISQSTDKALYAVVASYPLYSDNTDNLIAQKLMQLSVSFLYGYKTKDGHRTISDRGLILAINPEQWLPASQRDQSTIVDAGTPGTILLYCPVGTTMLKQNVPGKAKQLNVLQINQKCKPVITQCSRSSLQMSCLGDKYISPCFNAQAPIFLQKKLKKQPVASKKPSASLEQSLPEPRGTDDACTDND